MEKNVNILFFLFLFFRLFFAWSHNVRSFLSFHRKFLVAMNSSIPESWFAKPIRETYLKELFMEFTKIFFMEPEYVFLCYWTYKSIEFWFIDFVDPMNQLAVLTNWMLGILKFFLHRKTLLFSRMTCHDASWVEIFMVVQWL